MESIISAPHKKRWPAYVGAIGLVLIFGGLAIDVLHQISKGRDGAVATYYHAADALRHGNDPYAGATGAYPYVYPPLYAVCFEPLTRLTELAAARVMLGFNAVLVLAALLLTARAMLGRFRGGSDWGNVLFVAMLSAIVVAIPIHNELRGLETNSIVLLSFALAFYWIDRRPVLAGLALAVAINIKYLPIIAVPYLLLRRRWTAAVATLTASIAVALLPALVLGGAANSRYLHEAVSGLGHLTSDPSAAGAKVNGTGDLSSLSITSTIARLAAPSNWGKGLQLALVAAIAAIWGGSILIAYRRGRLPVLNWPGARQQRHAPFGGLLAVEWAALVTFALAFSPNTQNRNLVLAIIPATFAAAMLCAPIRARRRIAVAIATLVMLIGLVLPIAAMGKPFTIAWLADGGPCWFLLIAFILLAWAGISTADQMQSGEFGDAR